MNNKDEYKKIEGMLYNYPLTKIEIDKLMIEIDDLEEVDGIAGASGEIKAGSATHKFSSIVETSVFNRDEDMQQAKAALERKIRRLEREIRRIDNVLSILTDKERTLIELRYFKRYPVAAVSQVLDVTADTFHARRRAVFNKYLIPLLA